MKKLTFNPKIAILTAALLRLIPHLPNFTPLGAMGVFGGAYLSKKSSIISILSSMLVSDYLLLYINPYSPKMIDFSRIQPPFAMFHPTTIFVYASLLINVVIGWQISRRKSANWILIASLAASVQFFLITNFGVWAAGYYPQNLSGLLQSYIEGLPFFKWTVVGDLFYTTMLFGSYELITRISVRKIKVSAQ